MEKRWVVTISNYKTNEIYLLPFPISISKDDVIRMATKNCNEKEFVSSVILTTDETNIELFRTLKYSFYS